MDTKNIEALAKIVRKWNENDYNDLKITTAMKYKVIALFLPDNCQKSIKQAQKNHAGYNKEGLSYLMPEAFANLFIAICKLGGDPLNELEKTGRVSTGAFHRLIEGQSEEKKELHKQIDELEDKLEGSNTMPIKEYETKMVEMNKKIYELNKDLKKLQNDKDKQEEYHKEKIRKADDRAEERLKFLHPEQLVDYCEVNKQLTREIEIYKVKIKALTQVNTS